MLPRSRRTTKRHIRYGAKRGKRVALIRIFSGRCKRPILSRDVRATWHRGVNKAADGRQPSVAELLRAELPSVCQPFLLQCYVCRKLHSSSISSKKTVNKGDMEDIRVLVTLLLPEMPVRCPLSSSATLRLKYSRALQQAHHGVV